jgi:hypothetical protein
MGSFVPAAMPFVDVCMSAVARFVDAERPAPSVADRLGARLGPQGSLDLKGEIDYAADWLRCIWNVTFPRQRRRTLIFMAALALIAALGTALCVGYHLGRRSGSKPSTWKKRTSRVALGRLAFNLLMLTTARRIRQSSQVWRLRFIEPLGALRGSVARLRSY